MANYEIKNNVLELKLLVQNYEIDEKATGFKQMINQCFYNNTEHQYFLTIFKTTFSHHTNVPNEKYIPTIKKICSC